MKYLRRDLSRAAARSAVLFVVTFSLVLAFATVRLGWSEFVGCLTLSLLPFPLSMLEFHRARLPAQRRGGVLILIWCAALIVNLLYAAQMIYWEAGGLAGLDAAWADSQRMLEPQALISFAIAATLLTLVSVGRVPEQHAPVTHSLKWTAAVALLMVPLGGCGVFLGALFVVAICGWIYSLGDWVETKVWALQHHGEAAAMRRLRLPWNKLWLLAYLQHEPARGAMGRRAPVPSSDLKTWIKELGTGGEPARQQAALATLKLVVPLWEEAHPNEPLARDLVTRLVEHILEPTNASRQAALDATERWRAMGWESSVGFEIASAITASSKWGSTLASEAILRAARLVDEHCGEGTARAAISDALILWALEGVHSENLGSERSPPDITDPGRDSETDPAPPTA